MTERKKYLVAVAGGSGSRMGSDIPKQFLLLDGVPVLIRSISRFLDAQPGIKLIVALPRTQVSLWKDLCERHAFTCPHIVVPGGITRYHSVKNALEKVPGGALVAIHDGVRPLVSEPLIKEMFAAMDSHRALVPALPVTDTLKSRDGSAPDPDRSAYVAVQTPQIFRSEDIKEAYSSVGYSTAFTDDASVARAHGIPVDFFPGEKFNIKITVPEDLRLAELLLTL